LTLLYIECLGVSPNLIDNTPYDNTNTCFNYFFVIEEWQECGTILFELTSDSPELNLIEILWQFIKYEWIEIDAYSSLHTFVASVEKILREFGKNYIINFV
jgi:hypothetical protein